MRGRPSFLAELRRRNVIRMAGLYLVFAWLMTQVASTVLPMYGAPEWLPRSIVTLLAIGFLPALVFAWVFELTPEGLKFDADVPLEDSIGRQTARRMDRAIIVILALALGYFGFDKFVLAPRREATMVAAAQQEGAQREATKREVAQHDKSIAVLPLANDSGDAQQLYFSDGLTENLITALSQFDGLQVIGRSSSFRFRDSKQDSKAIGTKLGVAHLLEGSVRKLGDTVRINAQLVEAATGRTLWSQRYDRPYRDLFALQDEITQAVATALSAKLVGRAKAAAQSDRPPSGNLDAYAAFLHARFQYEMRTEESYRQAIGNFDRAIAIDPGYALAYAGRASARADLAGVTTSDAIRRLYPQAREDARRAVALAPLLAEAHLAMGRLRSTDFDLLGAEAEIHKAVALAPDAPRPLASLAGTQANLGRWDAAHALVRQAMRLDPLNATLYTMSGRLLMSMGRLDEAEHELRHALELRPEAAGNHHLLAVMAVMRGDAATAFREADAEPALWAKNYSRVLAFHVGTDHIAADAALREYIARYADGGAYQIAEIHGLRKQPDEMFRWLRRALAARDPGVQGLLLSPFLRPYRDDPRFTAFCREAGLPTPAEVDANRTAALLK